jgi:hypothetical protein
VTEYGEILGLEFIAPPAGSMPLSAIGVIEYLDDEGRRQHWAFESDNVTNIDALGMLKWRLIGVEQDVIDDVISIDNEGDDIDAG